MNDLMRDILGESGHAVQNRSFEFAPHMTQILDSGFRIEQGCVLFKDFVYFGPGDLDDSYKKTEYEEFLNNVQIHHSQLKVDNITNVLLEGIEFGQRLYEKLKETYSEDFRILIQADPPGLTSSDTFNHWQCNIKFHKIRPDIDAEFRTYWISMCNEFALLTIE